MTGFDTVTCVSDLGTADESVGVIHSIVRQAAPHAAVIDLCHEIDPGDARTAALMLVRSVPHLAPGVVLASVGRRLDRPAIAVSVGGGQSMLVGPDNGVLAAATAAVGGADLAVRIGDAGCGGPESVLHPARDVLAPAAGRLAAGEPIEAVGAPIDPSLLLPSLVAVPRVEDDGSVTAEVLSVTRWGTVQLNVDRGTLAPLGDLLVAEWTSGASAFQPAEASSQSVRLAPAGSAGTGSLALCDDPFGLLELTVAGGSAAHLGFAAGTEVRLRPSA
ncbi:SAM hydrolase/SAM-dependent halogenase family protein [Candidatus Poriferisodalis sp.]|uniref:SAM hydrolase/SAM-dependent halogenase family protein n=1 Tax=Candidatus Poriferisodalis sp. TaxID=3101277 RepID=UPI003B02A4EE